LPAWKVSLAAFDFDLTARMIGITFGTIHIDTIDLYASAGKEMGPIDYCAGARDLD